MKALILGSTGAVGKEILKQLLMDPDCEKVYTIGRRKPTTVHDKLTSFEVDLDRLTELPDMDADTLFVAFGTTLKVAGSKENQKRIDVEIPSKIMDLASKRGIKKCGLVSALGVSENSPFFYSRMKAELDRNARSTNFDHLVLIKPSVLDSNRTESRFGEKISIVIGNLIAKTGLINSYKPVKVEAVANALIQGLKKEGKGVEEILNSQIPNFKY